MDVLVSSDFGVLIPWPLHTKYPHRGSPGCDHKPHSVYAGGKKSRGTRSGRSPSPTDDAFRRQPDHRPLPGVAHGVILRILFPEQTEGAIPIRPGFKYLPTAHHQDIPQAGPILIIEIHHQTGPWILSQVLKATELGGRHALWLAVDGGVHMLPVKDKADGDDVGLSGGRGRGQATHAGLMQETAILRAEGEHANPEKTFGGFRQRRIRWFGGSRVLGTTEQPNSRTAERFCP